MSKLDEYLAGKKKNEQQYLAWKKKNEQRNKNTLNENTLNEGFREMPESDDPMERWWDGLQKTLDDADCDLDLGLPEDLCRLEILDIERVAADEYNFRAHYATDPERRPIDLADRSSESILSRQRVGMPDRSTLEHIYTAAQEGRLFVRSQRDYNPRQVTADAQGKSGVGHDIFNMTPDEADIGAVWEEPEKPKKPGFFTRVKAFFGNKNAKKTIKIYNLKVEEYQNNMQYWNRAKELEAENPQMVMHSRNLVLCNQLYYGDTNNNGEERLDYGITLQNMHREGVIRSLPAEKRDAARDLDDLQDRMNEYVNQLRSHRDNVVNAQKEATGKDTNTLEQSFEEQPLDEETKEALAGLFFCRAQQKLATRALDGDTGEQYVRLTGDELREAVRHYQDSPEFQQAITGRKNSMLHKVYTCEPEKLNKVADRVMEDAFTKQQPGEKKGGLFLDDQQAQVVSDIIKKHPEAQMEQHGGRIFIENMGEQPKDDDIEEIYYENNEQQQVQQPSNPEIIEGQQQEQSKDDIIMDGPFFDENNEQPQEEAFRKMQPNELGNYIKNLNEMARQAGNQPQTISEIGSQISAAMLFAQKNKLTAEQLGFEKKDIDAVTLNIEKGKRADIALNPQNEKEQTVQKKDDPKTMQKQVITEL